MAEAAAQTPAKTPPPSNGAASPVTTTASAPVPAESKPTGTNPLEGAKVDAGGKPLAPKPVETPAPAAAAPAKPEPQKDSQRFQIINQQTKKLIQDRAQFKREREQWQAERAQHDAELKEARELKQLIAEAARNPEALQKRVYGDKWYETLTNYVTADKQLTPELVAKDIDERVGKRLSELEKKLDAERKGAQIARIRAQEKADREIEVSFTKQAMEFVQANAEKYPFTARTNNHWRVPDLIKRNYETNGTIVSVEEAAAALEKHIAEVEAPLYAPAKAPEAPAAAKPPTPPAVPEQPRSLNNDMATSTPSSFYVGPTSDEEATKRALAAYRANRSVRQ